MKKYLFFGLIACFALFSCKKDKEENSTTNPIKKPNANEINPPSGYKAKVEPLNRRSASLNYNGKNYRDASRVNSNFKNTIIGENKLGSSGKRSNESYSVWVIEEIKLTGSSSFTEPEVAYSYAFFFDADGSYLSYNYKDDTYFWGHYKVPEDGNGDIILHDRDPANARGWSSISISGNTMSFNWHYQSEMYKITGVPQRGCFNCNIEAKATRYDLIDEDYVEFEEFAVAGYNAGIGDPINPAACFTLLEAFYYSDYSDIDLTGGLRYLQFNPNGTLASGYDGASTFDDLDSYEFFSESLDPTDDEELYDFFGPWLEGFIVHGDTPNDDFFIFVIDYDPETHEFYCVFYDEDDDDLVIFVMK